MLRDRRGVTAMAFTLMATALIGFAALATEVGWWFMLHNAVQATADAAAMSAVLSADAANAAGAEIDASAVTAAAQDAATQNGFGTATVTASGTANPSARVRTQAQATVSMSVHPRLTSLFLGSSGDITISAQATASVLPIGPACVLSTAGDLTISQAQAWSFTQCYYASNSFDATSINVVGASDSVKVYGFVTSWECSGCPPADPAFAMRPVSMLQPPVADPYIAAMASATAALPTSSTNPAQVTCIDPSANAYGMVPANGIAGNTTYPLVTGAPWYAYCGSITIPAATTVTFGPGVYLFVDAALTVSAGATVRCLNLDSNPCYATGTGVALVFTGTPPGGVPTLTIQPGATVNLTPAAGADYPAALFP
ncbi:MAG: hypothetical protein ACREOE_16515, partial [Gemmatimonadales bacterium]